jgi:hypothetical protein
VGQVDRRIEIARARQRFHTGLDVVDVPIQCQRERARRVAHAALERGPLELRVINDQPDREQDDGHDRSQGQEDQVSAQSQGITLARAGSAMGGYCTRRNILTTYPRPIPA